MSGSFDVFEFAGFRLDLRRGVLERGGKVVPIRAKSYALLSYLARNPERVMAKEELLDSVWGPIIVTEDTLTQTIKSLRDAMGNDGRNIIRTISKRGYLFSPGSAAPCHDQTNDRFAMEHPFTEGLLIRKKPSIAVLAFENTSGSAEQEYFAAGMVEDIITGLSRIKWLSVVARNQRAIHKSRGKVDIRQIGRELGVRYVLGGGIRRAGSRVRITARLLDAVSGEYLWADRFDGDLEDVFDLQDRITEKVVAVVEPNVQKSEIDRARRKRPERLDAYDLYLRAVPYTASQMPEHARIAMQYLQRALRIDPGYAAAHALIAWCHEWCFTRAGFNENDKLAALQHAHLATGGDTDDAAALAIASFVIAMLNKDYDVALSGTERALALNPSCATAMYLGAITNAFSGRPTSAIALADRALRLSPFDLLAYQAHFAQGMAAMQEERYEQARLHYLKALQANSKLSSVYFWSAPALALAGHNDSALSMAQAGFGLEPGFRLRQFFELMPPEVAGRFVAGGRILGLPQ
jgi:adenylate cyclase